MFLSKKNAAGEVRVFNDIHVHDRDGPHTHEGQVLANLVTQRTGTYDKNTRVAYLGLVPPRYELLAVIPRVRVKQRRHSSYPAVISGTSLSVSPLLTLD